MLFRLTITILLYTITIAILLWRFGIAIDFSFETDDRAVEARGARLVPFRDRLRIIGETRSPDYPVLVAFNKVFNPDIYRRSRAQAIRKIEQKTRKMNEKDLGKLYGEIVGGDMPTPTLTYELVLSQDRTAAFIPHGLKKGKDPLSKKIQALQAAKRTRVKAQTQSYYKKKAKRAPNEWFDLVRIGKAKYDVEKIVKALRVLRQNGNEAYIRLPREKKELLVTENTAGDRIVIGSAG